MSERLQVQFPTQILHWVLSILCCKAGYIFLLNMILLEILLPMWVFLLLFYFVCALVMGIMSRWKVIFRWISNMLNTDGIFHLPFKPWYTESICRRAVLQMEFRGGMHLFSKLWKPSHFMKTHKPLGRHRGFSLKTELLLSTSLGKSSNLLQIFDANDHNLP